MTRKHHTLAAALAAAAIAGAALPSSASARPTAHYLHTRTTIRVTTAIVFTHHVRICSWRPGDVRARPIVRYSRHLYTVPGWAGAGRRLSRAVCAVNGGTYRTARSPLASYLRPSGTVFAGGRRIRGVTDAPAVGFYGAGRLAFGARAARRHNSGNIMNALAYLVRKGVPLRRHAEAPWTTPAQFSCGAPGTDGVYGCSRTIVARWAGGRVGLVEIGHASMPLAARICRKLNIVDAATFDSGGAALMWTLAGTRNTASRSQAGHLFGATVGSVWHRRIPDAIVVNARKLP